MWEKETSTGGSQPVAPRDKDEHLVVVVLMLLGAMYILEKAGVQVSKMPDLRMLLTNLIRESCFRP